MNIQSMMAQAKKMQKDIETKQNAINNTEYTGSSEWVEVVMMGDYNVKKVNIKYKDLKEEDAEMLEDMIMLACNDARNKIEEEKQKIMGEYANLGGLM